MEKERRFFEPLHPSFFELTTALAFKYFEEQKVDIAVVEVGLGGRLDCTNIITPELSIITNISFDHTQFLGSTLAEIAAEKAGIIKIGVPVVIGETTEETRPVFERIAKERQAPIYFAEETDLSAYDGMEMELKGSYQTANRRTILCACNVLGTFSAEAIRKRAWPTCARGPDWQGGGRHSDTIHSSSATPATTSEDGNIWPLR